MAIDAINGMMRNVPEVKPVQEVELKHEEVADKSAKVNEKLPEKAPANADAFSTESNTEVSNEQIKKAVEKISKNLPNSEAVFGIHEGTNRITIKIIDKDTKEVIKELPPEKTLDMIAKAWEMAGLLVDERR